MIYTKNIRNMNVSKTMCKNQGNMSKKEHFQSLWNPLQILIVIAYLCVMCEHESLIESMYGHSSGRIVKCLVAEFRVDKLTTKTMCEFA